MSRVPFLARFLSAGVPSVVNIIVQILAFNYEEFFGLNLLACAALSGAGLQAAIASFGAVAYTRLAQPSTARQLEEVKAGSVSNAHFGPKSKMRLNCDASGGIPRARGNCD